MTLSTLALRIAQHAARARMLIIIILRAFARRSARSASSIGSMALT